MADMYSKDKRSKIMSKVKSKNTSLELKLRKELWNRELRYRIHYPIKGKPDVVFPKQKIAVFIDGDFWHGYNWKKLKNNLKNDFWKNKIKNNIKRDKKTNKILKEEGWKVIRFWGHDIHKNLKECIEKIQKELNKN